jgi:hypothetical protein
MGLNGKEEMGEQTERGDGEELKRRRRESSKEGK